MPRRQCVCAGAASRRSTSPAPVRYFRADEGGVSHFNYWRDNVLLTWMHARLLVGFLLRLPGCLLVRRPPRHDGMPLPPPRRSM